MMESERRIFIIPLIFALLAIIPLFLHLAKPRVKNINNFEECLKAGYPVALSYPRQCRTDGKVFTEHVAAQVCKSDAECGKGSVCKNGTCGAFVMDIMCHKDDDCELINVDQGFACCWVGACSKIDYSQSKWSAVNRNWFEKERSAVCPQKEACGPAPLCATQVTNEDYEAKCVDNTCRKRKRSESETNSSEKLCKDLCGDGVCQQIVCQAVGCPCSESSTSCPADCKDKLR